jgi:hypothetical protein
MIQLEKCDLNISSLRFACNRHSHAQIGAAAEVEEAGESANKDAPELEFTEAWVLPGLFASAQRVERDDWSSGVKPAPVYRYTPSTGAKAPAKTLGEVLGLPSRIEAR